ncbi:cytochrome c oxidase assembly protein [Gemmatimonadota bacterium DH-20]|uniref:Cytochrome c oxidase assembly protein n=1 Tax=Gaopeijia maritima TaxID=3119007 RepID=A0ABU9E3X8_9BACT
MQWWCAAQDVAWSWSWRAYPGVWIFIATLAFGFVRLHRRWPGRDPVFGAGARRGFAVAGLILLWIPLDWPVGALGAAYLASVHMIQFILIAVAAPPLLLLGIPRPALEAFTSRRVVGRVMGVLGHPIMSMSTFAVIMALTHWPPLADALMAGQAGSFVLDMVWLASGLLFWWPVAVALPERSWLKEPFKIGYLIAATLVNTGVFAFLTFSAVPVYATFELAPPVGTLTSRDDQLLAGLLMKLGGAVVLWTSVTVLFFRWFRRSETEDDATPRGAVATGLVLLLLAGGCGPAETALEGPLVIGEPVTGERAALYLSVRGGPGGDQLQSVEVDGVGAASMHRTEQSDGMMRMTHAHDGFAVGEGALLELRPGGDHVMLEELSATFVSGDSVRVVLNFRSGPIEGWAAVVPLADLEGALDGSAAHDHP